MKKESFVHDAPQPASLLHAARCPAAQLAVAFWNRSGRAPSPLDPEQTWALAAGALYTEIQIFNGRNDQLLPSTPFVAPLTRRILASAWEIRNTEEARQTLEQVLQQGHRKTIFAATHLECSAWDLVRVIHVARLNYGVGYLTADEAWSYMGRAAAGLRAQYGLWAEMRQAFLNGRAWWAGELDDEFEQAYRELLSPTNAESPWRKVVWESLPITVKPERFPASYGLNPAQQQWAVAASALLAELNNCNHTELYPNRNFPKASDWRESLEKFWGMESAGDVRATLANLLESGHRKRFAEQLGYEVVAWDLARAISVTREAAAAKWLSEAEAWQKIEKFAVQLFRAYPSWAALGKDYLAGHDVWAGGPDEDLNAVYSRLIDPANASSPWQRCAWSSFSASPSEQGVDESSKLN